MTRQILAVEAMPERCDQCRHFRRRDESNQEDSGSCRRWPPVIVDLDGELISAFPSVSPAISCGEFSPVLH